MFARIKIFALHVKYPASCVGERSAQEGNLFTDSGLYRVNIGRYNCELCSILGVHGVLTSVNEVDMIFDSLAPKLKSEIGMKNRQYHGEQYYLAAFISTVITLNRTLPLKRGTVTEILMYFDQNYSSI